MNLNILIIDDNIQFIKALEFLLTETLNDKIGKIVTRIDSKDLLDLISKESINLIFVDYEMPEIKGNELIKIIKENNRYIKIIAISFHNEFEVLERMILAGANNYLTKDELTKETLIHVVKSQFPDLF
jgi:CheY-like chemotaxis protein